MARMAARPAACASMSCMPGLMVYRNGCQPHGLLQQPAATTATAPHWALTQAELQMCRLPHLVLPVSHLPALASRHLLVQTASLPAAQAAAGGQATGGRRCCRGGGSDGLSQDTHNLICCNASQAAGCRGQHEHQPHLQGIAEECQQINCEVQLSGHMCHKASEAQVGQD